MAQEEQTVESEMRAAETRFSKADEDDEETETTTEETPVDVNEHDNEAWERGEGTVRDILSMDQSTLKELIQSTAGPPANKEMKERHPTVTSSFLSYGNFDPKDVQIVLLMNRRSMLLERMSLTPREATLGRELANAEINMMAHIGATKAKDHAERETLVTHISASKSMNSDEAKPAKKKGWFG